MNLISSKHTLRAYHFNRCFYHNRVTENMSPASSSIYARLFVFVASRLEFHLSERVCSNVILQSAIETYRVRIPFQHYFYRPFHSPSPSSFSPSSFHPTAHSSLPSPSSFLHTFILATYHPSPNQPSPTISTPPRPPSPTSRSFGAPLGFFP